MSNTVEIYYPKLSREVSYGPVIVDTEDFDLITKNKWKHKDGYIVKISTLKYLHRYIMDRYENVEGKDIHHIDHNPLNNSRSNLVACTHTENCRSQLKTKSKVTSKYKGVHWHIRRKKWMAQIKVNYRQIYLGSFVNEVDAAKAYDKKAKELFGEFAHPNFPYDFSDNKLIIGE